MVEEKDLLLELLAFSPEVLSEEVADIHPADFLEALEGYEGDQQVLLEKLPDDYLALLVDQAEDRDKYPLLSLFSDKRKESIISEMSSDELVDLLSVIDEAEKDAIMLHMDAEEAKEVQELLAYDPDTAGGIMATEFLAIQATMTVDETIAFFRTEAPDSETPYYVYVVDANGILKGIVPLRDIIISKPETAIETIMNDNIITIPVDMDQETVGHTFEKYGFMAMPVVDSQGVMLGIVTVDDIMVILKDAHTEDMFRLAGLDEEEKITGSIKGAVRSRLPWLLINMVTAILAAATVSLFEDTIAVIVALATFMPIVAGMGGNAGTQTLTMIIRGIALGELTLENQKDILRKEMMIGVINGIALGFIVALLGLIWVGNWVFGLVIGLAMIMNIIVAAASGFFVPVVLKKMRIDPALASAVFVTTVTDVLGFFFFLGLATLMIQWLV